jgi:glycosyltransferase involved in cell wall biosynthesis
MFGEREMLNGKKIVVVMPAYNAEKTLERTYAEIPKDIVDDIILTDDRSSDRTVEVAKNFDLKLFVHDTNRGYGANQKTCYKEALNAGADVVVMLHPDYQYSPRLITPMAALVTSGMFDVVLGSRILGNMAMKGGMPFYKYVANRLLTCVENNIIGQKLSEYHTGYRAFSGELLRKLPMEKNSNGFIFDNEILLEIMWLGYPIGEVSCPTHYFAEASSITFRNAVKYGLGVFGAAFTYRLAKMHLIKSDKFPR